MCQFTRFVTKPILCAIIAFWFVSSSSEVFAKRRNKKVSIAVMPYTIDGSIDPTRAGWIQRLFQWAFTRKTTLDVLSRADQEKRLYTEAKLSRGDKTKLRLIRRYLPKAKMLYHRFRRYKLAYKAIRICEKMANKMLQWPNDPDLFTEVFFYKAITAMALRKNREAAKYMLKTVQFNPQFEPDSGKRFPAQATNYFQSMKKYVTKNSRYTMKITSTPPGAKVYFNLRFKGKTPVTIEDIPPGKHKLVLTLKGYQTWSNVANLDAKKIRQRFGNKTTFENAIGLQKDPNALSVKGLPVFARDAGIDDGILDRLQAITRRLKVKYLFITKPYKQGSDYFMRIAFFQSGKRKIKTRILFIGKTRKAHRKELVSYVQKMDKRINPYGRRRVTRPRRVRKVRRRVRRRPRRRVRIEPDPVRRPRRRRYRRRRRRPIRRPIRRKPERRRDSVEPNGKGSSPFYATWWFWTAVGGVAAAATVTAVVITQTGPPPNATFIITTSSQQQ